MADAATVAVAREVRRRLAAATLTEPQAKLYSQRLRLEMGGEGLASFGSSDLSGRLDEAILLLECAILEKRTAPDGGWQAGFKRAAEILEWLSQPELRPHGAPLHLLAAAAYQTAGFPAMALGALRSVSNHDGSSVLLREFLRGDFPAAIEATRAFWRNDIQQDGALAEQANPDGLSVSALRQVVRCIGSVCHYLRTGDDAITSRAVAKLEHLAEGFLHSQDPYSHLLAMLTAASCRRFVDSSLWPHVARLGESSSLTAAQALHHFARSAFLNNRALVWPAQAEGISRLRANDSFALCTPTGSGKTTIATLAIVQALFGTEAPQRQPRAETAGNLVLYLVPSRALASEVEARLARDLRGISAEPVVLTGLYGGLDWGPTDVWVQTERPTVVVCTFEKADALLRYLGVLFLSRVRLVVVDEAHMVEHDPTRPADILDGGSRALCLEQLGARLLRAREEHGFRVVALSAVAAGAAPALARWIGGDREADATTSTYRSTRQMLGRLEVRSGGQFTIRYDLMDGRSLRFRAERTPETPFVPRPFPGVPGGIAATDGPEVRMRAPTLWAALHLAAERTDDSKPSVLISLTQGVHAFAATCVDLFDRWPEDSLPNYRQIPDEPSLWSRCLASAADYFGVESVEYRLLERGVVVHHGQMPALLARRLKVAIDRGYARVVVATSTLSEGVNIPINFLLLPSVFRGESVLTLREFTNLVGRAGRPGVATEGSALVMLSEPTTTVDRFGRRWPRRDRQREGYRQLVASVEETAAAGRLLAEGEARSPLAQLLLALEAAWAELTGSRNADEFRAWLEVTAVVGVVEATDAHKYLDSLDGFLIAAIHEVEELRGAEVDAADLEAELIRIWRSTYAHAASNEERRLVSTWLARGRAVTRLYPDLAVRRRYYKTSLSPRPASILLNIVGDVRTALQLGTEYAAWSVDRRLEFISDILRLLSRVPSFSLGTRLGRQRRPFDDWPTLLRWWLAKATLRTQPTPAQVTSWYDYVAANFVYRGSWGLGAVIGLLMDVRDGGRRTAPLNIADWPRTGLPWVAFWLKELLTWGTLDPVAAFLLARGDAIDRPTAEAAAREYYDTRPPNSDSNSVLDPRRIRDWVGGRRYSAAAGLAPDLTFPVVLERPLGDYLRTSYLVNPIETADSLAWIDPAGYAVARSPHVEGLPTPLSSFDFTLDVPAARITCTKYIPYSDF